MKAAEFPQNTLRRHLADEKYEKNYFVYGDGHCNNEFIYIFPAVVGRRRTC